MKQYDKEILNKNLNHFDIFNFCVKIIAKHGENLLKGLNMIKRKKSICLAIAALSAVSLSGCSSVTSNSEGYILTYTYNGKELSISTREIIDRYLNENRNDHAAAFYNALNEVVIRRAFEEGGPLASFKSTVDNNATNDVNNAKDEADEGGTSWSDYLDGQITDDSLTTEDILKTSATIKKIQMTAQLTYKMNIIFYMEPMATSKTKFLITLDTF